MPMEGNGDSGEVNSSKALTFPCPSSPNFTTFLRTGLGILNHVSLAIARKVNRVVHQKGRR